MSYAESYAHLDDWVIGAPTENLGLDAWYQPLNDIASPQGKIGGAAQERLAGGAVLRHVTMAYAMDPAMMLRVLGIGREKLSDKCIPSASKRVGPLRLQTRLPRAEITDELTGYFRRRHGLTRDSPTVGELRAAQELARTKFTSTECTARVP
jgi:lipoate---protein ligase